MTWIEVLGGSEGFIGIYIGLNLYAFSSIVHLDLQL